MKKGVLLLAVLLLATALSACGGKKEEGIAAHIEINGVELVLNAEFTAEKAEALGKTDQVIEAPSCHYDGSDSIYYYPGLYGVHLQAGGKIHPLQRGGDRRRPLHTGGGQGRDDAGRDPAGFTERLARKQPRGFPTPSARG